MPDSIICRTVSILDFRKKPLGEGGCNRVVGRMHSRMNRFRRPLTRREKTSENDGTLLHFSCGLIVWNKVLLRQALNSYWLKLKIK
ncbi:transposase [Erwinia tracheiphila PSU-1]|nr:transposase [Erwinia tracheiphila PSU-1]